MNQKPRHAGTPPSDTAGGPPRRCLPFDGMDGAGRTAARTPDRASAARLLGGIAFALLAGLALSGCSNNSPNGAPPAAGPSGQTPGGSGKRIAIISPAKTSEFHNELPKGAADEAKKLGWPDIIDKAPQKEDDYAGQVSQAQDVIQQHPDAISVCGINPQALDEIVKKANNAKIPIWVHNQITTVKGDVVAYVGYDEREGGRLCGEKAAELLKAKNGDYKGEVAILDGEPGAHTDERAGGFKDALLKHPGIKLDAEQNGKWDRTIGNTTTKDWLQKYAKLDLVFGCSDAMAQGASKAGADANHPLITIGIDGNKTSLQDVRDGKLTATLAVQPRMIGARIVDSMNDYFQNKTQPNIIKTEMTIVTKDNVGKFLTP
jgi:ribose transport system substrate-binding protein